MTPRAVDSGPEVDHAHLDRMSKWLQEHVDKN